MGQGCVGEVDLAEPRLRVLGPRRPHQPPLLLGAPVHVDGDPRRRGHPERPRHVRRVELALGEQRRGGRRGLLGRQEERAARPLPAAAERPGHRGTIAGEPQRREGSARRQDARRPPRARAARARARRARAGRAEARRALGRGGHREGPGGCPDPPQHEAGVERERLVVERPGEGAEERAPREGGRPGVGAVERECERRGEHQPVGAQGARRPAAAQEPRGDAERRGEERGREREHREERGLARGALQAPSAARAAAPASEERQERRRDEGGAAGRGAGRGRRPAPAPRAPRRARATARARARRAARRARRARTRARRGAGASRSPRRGGGAAPPRRGRRGGARGHGRCRARDARSASGGAALPAALTGR